MTRKRKLATAAGILAALVLALGVAGLLAIRSRWFFEMVRRRVIDTVETATGGRVEVRSFAFEPARLRAEIRDFVIHGTEPADKPPLFRASTIAVGLKIVSLLRRDVDVQYLEVAEPRVYLIVYPDGRTNVPEPKIRKKDGRNALETILDLAVGRFDIRDGIFEVEARGKTPFEARGQHLTAKFQYGGGLPPAAPYYRGDISIQPLDVRWPGVPFKPFEVAASVTLGKNRIDVSSMKLTSGASRLEIAGAIEDLNAPHGAFQYTTTLAVAQVAPLLKIDELKAGTVAIHGQANWRGSSDLVANGSVRGSGIEFRDSSFFLRDGAVDAALSANAQGIDLTGVRLSTSVSGAGKCEGKPVWPCPSVRIAVTGRIARATERGKDLEFHSVAMDFLGGGFEGEASLRNLRAYTVRGSIAGIDARRAAAVFSPEALPWNASAAGPVSVEGVLGRKQELKISANLAISPAAGSAPVHGQIAGTYVAAGEALDLGQSTLTLPASRVDFSGGLPPAPGRELRVHFESRDLNDVLPVIGVKAASAPVKLEGGQAIFDGNVTGKLAAPRISGRLAVTRFALEGRSLDSLDGLVTVSPDRAEIESGTVTRGPLRAQFQGSAGMTGWKMDDGSPIAGTGSIRNAAIGDLTAALQGPPVNELPSGMLTASGQVGGTVGKPTVTGDVEIVRGSFHEEPFDRVAAKVSYVGQHAEVTGGQIVAGAKQVQLSAAYDHDAAAFDRGRLHFHTSSNVMPLEQIRTLEKQRPGVRGTVQISADGELAIAPAGNSAQVRIADLRADVAAKGLELDGQPLGDAHLTASSRGQVLTAHLESDFANSVVQGDGEFRLEGDYPGSATVRFSKLDLARLRGWISPSKSGAAERVSGSAEGELHLEGPAAAPEKMKAELRIPQLEIGPAPGSLPPAGALRLTNSGPVVLAMANSVVTVESARLVGRSTDLAISGRIALDQKSPLDLRVNGRVDLAIVQTFNHDLVSSGTLSTDATLRGSFDNPQVNGRVQFQNAAFALADFPNGISNANGVVLFTAERATIQSFTGETGGGKIELTGSAGYSESGPVVFQLQVNAQQVRVRYPEGVSTVANAKLNLTGTPERSMLDGTITILRTGFNLQSDFSSIIAKSAEPVRTPAAQTGILGGLNFDIQINTDPDIQLQSALTQDLQADANLRLRGTVSNPAVVGRVTITQGQVVFYGTKYSINQGTISFYNALKVEPILDVDLETKARGIDITLTVAGPLNKLRLTPRSDPPLQFSEIVALLATGRTPTSDPTMLTQQSTAPQSWQQMGASALLGQAIASPVAGRLQRFFGVSKLRIDPTLPGVENNPQARLTLEQQVTSDITFTYITNVTSSNPQVVRMEWSVSKQWSVVLLRDENGTFGVDFFFKKRF